MISPRHEGKIIINFDECTFKEQSAQVDGQVVPPTPCSVQWRQYGVLLPSGNKQLCRVHCLFGRTDSQARRDEARLAEVSCVAYGQLTCPYVQDRLTSAHVFANTDTFHSSSQLQDAASGADLRNTEVFHSENDSSSWRLRRGNSTAWEAAFKLWEGHTKITLLLKGIKKETVVQLFAKAFGRMQDYITLQPVWGVSTQSAQY